MSDMIAYEWRYQLPPVRLYLTGKCKTKTINYSDGRKSVYDYAQHRVHFLGISLWTRWVDKTYISYRKEVEEFYDCDESKS